MLPIQIFSPKLSFYILILTISLFATVSTADENKQKTFEKEHQWSGKFSVGLNEMVGNTNTKGINLSIETVYNKNSNTTQGYQHTFTAALQKEDFSATKDGERSTTVDKKALGYTLEYFLNEKSRIRALATYNSDELATINSFVVVALEYERDLIKNQRHMLKVNGGFGNAAIKYTDSSPNIKGFATKVGMKYKGTITHNFSFNQDLIFIVLDGLKTRYTNTALEYAFNEKASISFDNKITHYSSIPVTSSEHTDRITSMNFNIKY